MNETSTNTHQEGEAQMGSPHQTVEVYAIPNPRATQIATVSLLDALSGAVAYQVVSNEFGYWRVVKMHDYRFGWWLDKPKPIAVVVEPVSEPLPDTDWPARSPIHEGWL